MFVLIGTAGSPGTYSIALEREESERFFLKVLPSRGGTPQAPGAQKVVR